MSVRQRDLLDPRPGVDRIPARAFRLLPFREGFPVTETVLEVQDLVKHFPVNLSIVQRALLGNVAVHAVDGVSFSLQEGEILGLVGESGSGKTTVGRTVLRLLEPSQGTIRFRGTDITHLKEKTLRPMRRKMQMIFQDPHAALNPAMTIGQSIADPLIIHESAEANEARTTALRMMTEVGLAPAEQLYGKYPADLSGGQKQRAVIARAMILNPELIVADEPVAMLDMSIRAKILELLLDLRRRYPLAFLFITHDLATAKFLCDRIAIMYLGRIVETGPSATIFRDPKHPYTRALIAAVPIPDPRRRARKVLPKGEVPDAVNPPMGCRFHPRCPAVLPTCGWEGRDFLDYLEERRTDLKKGKVDEVNLGPLDLWKAKGLVAERHCRPENIAIITEYIRSILNEAPSPLSKAVERVRNVENRLVVQFRTPDPLAPKEVEGRLVECLLY